MATAFLPARSYALARPLVSPKGIKKTPIRTEGILDDHEMPFYHFAVWLIWNDGVIQEKVIGSADSEPETWPAWTDLPLDQVLDALDRTEKGGAR